MPRLLLGLLLVLPATALAQRSVGLDGGGVDGGVVDGGAAAVASTEGGEDAEDGEEVDGAEDPAESEAVTLSALDGGVSDGGLLYTADLSDAELSERFVENLASLGSISVGFAEAGRLINGVQVPAGEAWEVVAPELAWATQDTIDFLVTVAREVHRQLPNAPKLRISHIGKREGGYVRPHKSHQSGRDVDLGFYYRSGVDPGRLRGRREQVMDVAANWALVRALAVHTDVQVILVDKRVKKVLRDYALEQGEDRGWVEALFAPTRGALLQHARGHRDHFHVRFFSARAQELGRRVQPLLAKRSDQNVVIHRIRRGETLGSIARQYGSTVQLIQRTNKVASNALRIGRTLNIPLRGPCTHCPLVPPLVVPPRRLPPPQASASAGSASPAAGAP